jgi:hypothetical protein
MTTANQSKCFQLAVALLAAATMTACQSASPSPTVESSSGAPLQSSSASPSPGPVGHWEPAGAMTSVAWNFQAVALEDGGALVIGDDTHVEIWHPDTGTWSITESLNNPRTNFAAVALEDGEVLVTGGLNDMRQSYSSAYVFDPTAETWTKVGLMDTARTDPSAALLPDGRVLVAGGYFYVEPNYGRAPALDAMLAAYRLGSPSGFPPGGPGEADIAPPNVGAALATAELFDPATGTWSLTSPLNFARSGAAAVTLADGRILVVGSVGTEGSVTVDDRAFDSAEIYDPATGRFTLAGTLPAIDRAALEAEGVPLPGGDPAPGGTGTLIALEDGGALLIGHWGWWKHQGDISRSFRLNAETETWHEVGQPYAAWEDPGTGESYATSELRFRPAAARLGDGGVIIAGGDGRTNQTSGLTKDSADIYDPVADTWSPLPPMPEPRAGGTALTLTDGSVLLVGGYVAETGGQQTALASAVRFVP